MADDIDYEMVEDVKELINRNPDVRISEELLAKLNSYGDMDLVQIQKNFSKGIEIISIEKVTEKLINNL